MKKALRSFGNLVSVPFAALAGNWLGDQLRAAVRGEPGHEFRFAHVDDQGEVTIAVNLVLSNFIPALLLGLTAKPRWLWAFVGGAVSSFLMGERYEDLLWERFKALQKRG